MNFPRNSPFEGFALLAVLVLLAILSIIASSVVLVTERSVDEMQARIDRAAADVDALSTRETVMFLLSTQRMTVGGLTVDGRVRLPDGSIREIAPIDEIEGYSYLALGNEVTLDGVRYQGVGTTEFALQDGRGLLNPNWSPRTVRHGWWGQLGVPGERFDELEDSLADFQDPDQLRRLNGAERREYQRAGLPAPGDRPLVTPIELRAVRGWSQALAEIGDDELMSGIQLATEPFINLNSARLESLAAIPNLGRKDAERTVNLRRGAPWSNKWDWALAFDVRDETLLDTLFVIPSKNGTLLLCGGRNAACELVHWSLTGNDEGGYPWRFNYDYPIPNPAAVDQQGPATAETRLFAPTDPDRAAVDRVAGRR